MKPLLFAAILLLCASALAGCGADKDLVCCRFESRTETVTPGDKSLSEWEAGCECKRRPCSRIGETIECGEGSCDTTTYRNVEEVKSCE